MSQVSLDLSDVSALLLAGKILSVVAVVLVLAVIVNIWRRSSFPAVSYGSIVLSPSRMRWLWLSVIVGATALGAAEDPIARSMETSEDTELLETADVKRQSTFFAPFPFYRYERLRVYADGELAVDNVTEGFLIPWALLSALLAYLVLVMRWNPESRIAIRILKGPKRRRDPDDDPIGTRSTSGG